MGKKAEALATELHGKTRKENQAEAKAFATDEHGITRKKKGKEVKESLPSFSRMQKSIFIVRQEWTPHTRG